VAYYNTPAYCASKGAVSQLTKQVALDYAKDGIRW
jgi:NAD(P)-dependent dehydrogenase (short-subunit alcohol dehydrogenase family)